MLEGRGWMNTAIEHGAKTREAKDDSTKFYCYQLFTTVWLEFDSLEQMVSAIKEVAKKDSYWDYDPVEFYHGDEVITKDVYWQLNA